MRFRRGEFLLCCKLLACIVAVESYCLYLRFQNYYLRLERFVLGFKLRVLAFKFRRAVKCQVESFAENVGDRNFDKGLACVGQDAHVLVPCAGVIGSPERQDDHAATDEHPSR